MNYSSAGLASVMLFPIVSGCSGKALNTLNIPANAPFKMQYLRDNVGIFTERGGTIMWYVDRKGMAVVDTQFPDQAKHLLERLNTIKKVKLDALVNTHHHGDHTAGNVVFKDVANRIVAHANSKINQENNAAEKGELDKAVLPNVTFNDAFTLDVGSSKMTCQYYGAGHTNGDISVFFENENIVHIGDLVFNRRYPYIDKANGANIGNWIEVLEKLEKSFDHDTIYVWGHASEGYPVHGGKQELVAFRRYLTKLLEYGESCVKSGKSIDEVIDSTKNIPGAEDWVGDGIERSLRAVYLELGQ